MIAGQREREREREGERERERIPECSSTMLQEMKEIVRSQIDF